MTVGKVKDRMTQLPLEVVIAPKMENTIPPKMITEMRGADLIVFELI